MLRAAFRFSITLDHGMLRQQLYSLDLALSLYPLSRSPFFSRFPFFSLFPSFSPFLLYYVPSNFSQLNPNCKAYLINRHSVSCGCVCLCPCMISVLGMMKRERMRVCILTEKRCRSPADCAPKFSSSLMKNSR